MEIRRPLRNDPIEAARAELQKLRASDDWNEPTPVVHVNMHQAAAARRSSPAPAPAPTPPPTTVQLVFGTFQRFPPWGAVAVAIVAIAAWVYLAIHGKAPVP